MERAIDAALGLIFADLAADGGPLPRVEPSAWQPWTPSESVMLWADDGSGAGAWLNLALPDDEALAELADQVQEWVIEERARQRGPTNWPVCAAHPTTHPCRPVVEQGRGAVWVCPSGDAAPVPIGEVRPTAPRRPHGAQ